MGVNRDHDSGPFLGGGIVQQEGVCPEGTGHGDGAPGVVLTVEQDASHRLEIERAEIGKASWGIRQADDPGRVLSAPDHWLAGDGNVRIVDKTATSNGPGTPPTGERDCH